MNKLDDDIDKFAEIDMEGLVVDRDANAPVEYNMGGYYGYGDNLLKPSKEARSATGWAKSDDIKWKKDKKERKVNKKESIKTLSQNELYDILDDLGMDDDLGPKGVKPSKVDDSILEESSVGEPNWDEFFAQLPE